MPEKPQNASDKLQDASILHGIAIQRVTKTARNNVLSDLVELRDNLQAKLNSTAVITDWQRQRSTDLLKYANNTIDSAYQKVGKKFAKDLTGISDATIKQLGNAVNETVGVSISAAMTPKQLEAISNTGKLLIQGATQKDWWGKQSDDLQYKFAALVKQGMLAGKSVGEMTQPVADLMDASSAQAEALIRTAVATTQSNAQQAYYAQNDDLIKGVQQVSTLDSRTTEQCRARDGLAWSYPDFKPIGHEIKWNGGPPLHFNCVVNDTLILPGGQVMGVFERWYEGDLVIVYTATGKKLRCTPNHPILTDTGWQRASLLYPGARVISYRRGEWERLSADKSQNVISSIHEITEAFRKASSPSRKRINVLREDFHGDGIGSKIAIVSTNRKLGGAGYSPLSESDSDFIFDRTFTGLIQEMGKSCFATKILGSALNPLFRSESSPPDFVSMGVRSDKPPFSKDTTNGSDTAIHAFCDSTDTQPCLIELDNILSVEIISWCGHVNNIDTVSGIYAAQGIITHNCRSTTIPILRTWQELSSKKLEQEDDQTVRQVFEQKLADQGFTEDEIKGIHQDQRASMDGQVAEALTYEEWLKTKPESFQQQVLGQSRWQLWNDGKMSLSEMIDGNGQPLTIPELHQGIKDKVAVPLAAAEEGEDGLSLAERGILQALRTTGAVNNEYKTTWLNKNTGVTYNQAHTHSLTEYEQSAIPDYGNIAVLSNSLAKNEFWDVSELKTWSSVDAFKEARLVMPDGRVATVRLKEAKTTWKGPKVGGYWERGEWPKWTRGDVDTFRAALVQAQKDGLKGRSAVAKAFNATGKVTFSVTKADAVKLDPKSLKMIYPPISEKPAPYAPPTEQMKDRDFFQMVYGDKLQIHGDRDKAEKKMGDMRLLPDKLHKQLASKGLSIVLGDKMASEYAETNFEAKPYETKEYKETRTAKETSGCYDSAKKQVFAGDESRSGSASTVIHELFHAIGNLLSGPYSQGVVYDNQAGLYAAHKEFWEKIESVKASDPHWWKELMKDYGYYLQDGLGGTRGRKEMLAESGAIFLKQRLNNVALRFGDKMRDYIKGIIEDVS